jgi:hypothetical protein
MQVFNLMWICDVDLITRFFWCRVNVTAWGNKWNVGPSRLQSPHTLHFLAFPEKKPRIATRNTKWNQDLTESTNLLMAYPRAVARIVVMRAGTTVWNVWTNICMKNTFFSDAARPNAS